MKQENFMRSLHLQSSATIYDKRHEYLMTLKQAKANLFNF